MINPIPDCAPVASVTFNDVRSQGSYVQKIRLSHT